VDALEFLARVVSHIPEKGQVLQRYYGWYANRARGIRRRTGGGAEPPVVVAAPVAVPHRAAQRRWAELLRRLFEVDPLACPRCGQTMRIVACITEPPVIDRILAHVRRAGTPRRWSRAPPPAAGRGTPSASPGVPAA